MAAPYAEITRADVLGSALAEQAARRDVRTIVEIGTWSGMGSTLCIIDGILRSGDFDKRFFTFEIDADRHREAVDNLKDYSAKLPNLRLIHGSVIRREEMPPFEASSMNKDWYDKDINSLSAAPCRFDLVPADIDLLFIDGGEYAGEAEFYKLWERSRIILLDDTRTFKNRRVRRRLIYDRRFAALLDRLDYRNGCSGFERLTRKRNVFSNMPVAMSEFRRILRGRLLRLLKRR